MKILLITDGLPPDVLGGAGQIVRTTAEGLAKCGHDVSIITATAGGTVPASSSNIPVYAIPRRSSRWAHYRGVLSGSRANETLRIIDEVRPDIIHAHSIAWQAGYRWIPGARKRGIPVFLTAHDVMYVAYGRVTGDERLLFLRDLKRARWTWNPLRNIIIRSLLNRYCRVLCVSDALRDYLTSFGFTNLTTLHNGIDLNFWKPSLSQKDARAGLGLLQNKTIFLLAGRLGVDKGSKIVARTLPADAHLLLAGDVDEESFASVRERARVLGRQTSEQMKSLYAACDVALVPSICLDCFPTICLEAMANSRPVLATTFGGAKEAAEDGVTGWIIDPRDKEAFGAKMEWCVRNRTALPSFGEKGRKRAEKLFAMEDHIAKLISLYEESTKAYVR